MLLPVVNVAAMAGLGGLGIERCNSIRHTLALAKTFPPTNRPASKRTKAYENLQLLLVTMRRKKLHSGGYRWTVAPNKSPKLSGHRITIMVWFEV